MELKNLMPWNWFKHEEEKPFDQVNVPVSSVENQSNQNGIQVRKNPTDIGAPDNLFDWFSNMQREMDQIFNRVFNGFGLPSTHSVDQLRTQHDWPMIRAWHKPTSDISGKDDEYTINVDLPGVQKDDIELTVHGGRLVVKATMSSNDENTQDKFYRIERRYGEFQRVLSLPDDANTEGIQATLENGVLHIVLPRTQSEANVRHIPISS